MLCHAYIKIRWYCRYQGPTALNSHPRFHDSILGLMLSHCKCMLIIPLELMKKKISWLFLTSLHALLVIYDRLQEKGLPHRLIVLEIKAIGATSLSNRDQPTQLFFAEKLNLCSFLYRLVKFLLLELSSG